jgi:hypothetical protein
MTDSDNTLYVDGDSGDKVDTETENLTQGSDITKEGVTYHTYTGGGVTLYIEDGVDLA